MSATPIPRTLHMALTGARDMSLINTRRQSRSNQNVRREYKLAVVRTAILHEIERAVRYISYTTVLKLSRLLPSAQTTGTEARIAIGHGQMSERDLET